MVILMLIVLLAGVVMVNLNSLRKVNREIVDVNKTGIIIVERLLNSFPDLVKAGEKYVVSGDMDYYERFQMLKQTLFFDMDELERLLNTKEDRQLLGLARSECNLYLVALEEQSIHRKKVTDLPPQVLEEKEACLMGTVSAFQQIIELNEAAITEKTTISNRRINRILLITLVVGLVVLAAGISIFAVTTRSITRSVSLLKDKTKEIAEGRFDRIGALQGPIEIQDLAHHFDIMCQRLGELDALKADFVSHVSHELKTPLAAIKEASAMLSNGLFAGDGEKQEELHFLIRDECDRLLDSVVRILDYSKMEASEMEYRFDSFFLPQVIQMSILKLAPLCDTRNIDLEFIPPPRELPLVLIDRDRILEVMNNLIGNAIKFTPGHGRISVSIDLEEKEKLVKVSVADTGCGIAPGHLTEVFEKFKQIDNGVGTRMGTGLGLSISKYIIKAHRGNLWAKSDISQGTTMVFTLPAV
ncbi:MAG: HAMP domain-containing protein [Desulfobacteraceae bacterium]|nr:HAMP domain-containing protein [Desulfobacteraceae bacterium]